MRDASVRAGFVGLGEQGAPMAERVLAAGWPLAIYARRAEVRTRFAALGATVAQSLAELRRCSDLLSIVVIDDAQVREVLLDTGMLEALAPGAIVAIHITVHPQTCRELAHIGSTRGIHVIDAPVSGAVNARQPVS